MRKLLAVAQVTLTSALILAQQFVHHRLDSRLVVGCVAGLALLGLAPVFETLWIEKVVLPREEKSMRWLGVTGPGSYGTAKRMAERLRATGKTRS